MNETSRPQRVGLTTATFLAAANMIGTGVFTSLGYQTVHTREAFSLLALWVLGGLIALCGALCYAELGTRFPRSGGEYHLLSTLYHPVLGFLSGWVSLIAGFAAPVAIAAMAFASYTQAAIQAGDPRHLAAFVVILLSLVHCFSISIGKAVQNVFTVLKLALMAFLIAAGLLIDAPQNLHLAPGLNALAEMTEAPYFISLVFVSFAYTGWNASVYIVSEVRNPAVTLPKAILMATCGVLVLYVLLNYVFLLAVPVEALTGKIEIGFIAARHIFGSHDAGTISLFIALLMISTIGAMIFVGSRILQAMGEDHRLLSLFSKWSKRHTPVRAILFQSLISLLFIYTSSFEQVLVYSTFVLILMNNLTVAGLFIARLRNKGQPGHYRTWGYPVTPVLFLTANTAIMGYVILERPADSLIGMLIILTGLIAFWLSGRR